MANQQENTKEPEKPKMSIDQLRYIVMEGGGARGNTYLGAIRALENQLSKRVAKINPENKPDGIEKIAGITNTGNQRRKPGVMDFLKKDPGKPTEEAYIPIIEGVAGASAGAITTFGLALGLNADEIEKVLEFPFQRFLSEIDAGKYRMIAENSNLAIGEDDKVERAHKTLLRFRQANAVGKKQEPFVYDLGKEKTEIRGNAFKYTKRELLFTTILSTIVRGAYHTAASLKKLFGGNSDNKSFVEKIIEQELAEMSKGGVAGEAATALATRLYYSIGLRVLAAAFFDIKSKDIQVNGNTVLAIFKDRGMFSGFQVREFFYDMLLFAATRDTYFQKRLIIYFNNLPADKYKDKKAAEGLKGITKEDLTYPLFEIGSRHKTDFSNNATKLFNYLQDLTFREFFHILNVEYAAAVSNFTTNSPLYFSDEFTPDFRVLEAVAASMSIPPAIRPVYNASDVLFSVHKVQNEGGDRIYNLPAPEKNEPLKVKIDERDYIFVTYDNDNVPVFTKSDYELLEYVVKKAMQEFLVEKKRIFVTTNNLIELNTFLTEMRYVLVGDRDPAIGKNPEKVADWEEHGRPVIVNNSTFVVTKDLLLFFYNAQFKGLLLDGGYFNNIPFNYFRDKGDETEIDGVFPIKLDGHFPPDFLNGLMQDIPSLKDKAAAMMNKMEAQSFVETRAEIADIIKLADSKLLNDPELLKIEKQVRLALEQYIMSILPKRQLNKLDKKVIKKVVKEWYRYHGKHNNIKPWEEPRQILDIAFTGYAYGAKRGQIRNMTDHRNIVSLYDYGVTTYDFALKEVDVLAKIAQDIAEKTVNEYFDIQL